MPAPTVPYKLRPDGFTIDGDRQRGYRARAPFLVAWSDAFTFADQVLGSTSGSSLPPTWILPWRFPNSGNARLFAQRFTMTPCGADGQAEPPNKGLLPGEFFTHVIVTVEFETPDFVQDPSQDPANAMQLDPAEPITLCEQSVRVGSKMVTRKAGGYEFDPVGGGAATPVKGDFALPECESQLVLTFPRVPALPWKKLRPYIGRVNLTAILDVPKGALLLEGSDLKYVASSDGTLSTQAQLVFAANHDDRDWNELEKPDGTWGLVRRKGDTASRIFGYKEFRDIFA